MVEFFKGFFSNKKIIELISIFLILALLTIFVDGGIFGEERIYELFGQRNKLVFSFCQFLAVLGSAKILIPFLIISLIYSFTANRRDLFIGMTISVLGSYILSGILKHIFLRTRPLSYMLVDQAGYSFPSTHTLVNTALSLFIAYYLSRYIDYKNKETYFVLASIYSILIAFSRVYLGVHYISDTLGGLLGGVFVLCFIIYLLKYLRFKENLRINNHYD